VDDQGVSAEAVSEEVVDGEAGSPGTTSREGLLLWVVALLVAVVVLQVAALVVMNNRMTTLQDGVDDAVNSAEVAGMRQPATDPSTLGACRILGGLSVKAGVDLATVFQDEFVSTDCQTAAEAAAQAVRGGG